MNLHGKDLHKLGLLLLFVCGSSQAVPVQSQPPTAIYQVPMIEVFTGPANISASFSCPANPISPGLPMYTKYMQPQPGRGYVWYSCLTFLTFPLDSVTKSALTSWQNCNSIPVSRNSPSGMLCSFKYPQGEPPLTTLVLPNDALGGNAYSYREMRVYTTTGSISTNYYPTQNYTGGTAFSSATQFYYPDESGVTFSLPSNVGEQIISLHMGGVKTNSQVTYTIPNVNVPNVTVTPPLSLSWGSQNAVQNFTLPFTRTLGLSSYNASAPANLVVNQPLYPGTYFFVLIFDNGQ